MSSAEKPKEKSEHPYLYLRNSSSDASWLLQIQAGETWLLLLQFANRESVQTDCAVIFVHQQVFGWNEFSSDFEGHKWWTERRIFFSRVDFLCWLLFRYPFHPRVTAVARKRSRSFCQKCRWQVTAKHAYTLCMWLCMKWHGAWLYGVHRTCAETAAVSCGTSHASAVSTPLRWIFKKRAIKLVTHVEPHASAVSLLKRAENSAI